MSGIRLGLVYNPSDHKLQESSYSHTYKNQFYALMKRFDSVQHITKPVSASDILADVIIFYDVHSCNKIEIRDIEKHKALKYTYFNDPQQKTERYVSKTGVNVVKLGAKDRADRALSRGVDFIICPQKNMYYKHIAPCLNGQADNMLVWFPPVPKDQRIKQTPLIRRIPEVIMNGHTWKGEEGFRPYEFRTWSAFQTYVAYINHSIKGSTPSGSQYQKFLSQYAGALALCDTQIVPKYFEIPLAGCVCFAQYQPEYEELGFIDKVNCIYVNRDNLEKEIVEFKKRPQDYQGIADAGRKLVAENYTSNHFANFIYNHCKERL